MKYHVRVDQEYWFRKIIGFEGMKPEEQNKAIIAEVKEMIDELEDPSNDGKRFIVTDSAIIITKL